MGRSSSTSTTRVKKPAWLEGLMGETTFFGGCGTHFDKKKNEKNVFCMSCCLSLCPHCLPSHPHHPFLQVRRYVYHDVIRLDDLQKLIDCSYIQPYTINGAKVIFLKERAQQSRTSGNSKGGSPNICISCDRFLQEPFHFCSLSCKVNHMTYQGEDLSSILRQFDESQFTISQLDGLLRMDNSEMDENVTDNSIFDEPLSYSASRPCSSNVDDDSGASHHNNIARRKKKASGFLPGIGLSFGNRRKGAPQRSPFC